MKPLKVLLLSTSDDLGGAAIAAVRLQAALATTNAVVSKLLVQEKNTDNQSIKVLDSSWWGKKKAFLRFVADRIAYRPYEASKSARFSFDAGLYGTDISQHPLVQEADILHLHWINFGFLSVGSIQKLLALGKPVVWTLHDMWAFTGGCHHSGDCNGFMDECGDCKFMKYPAREDLSGAMWQKKSLTYASDNLTIVTCSDWLQKKARQSSLFSGKRIESIPNPLDTSIFRDIPKAEARQKLGLPQNKKIILFAAMRVEAPGKGFAYFREALEHIKTKYPEQTSNIELVLFGGGTPPKDLPLASHSLGRLSDPATIATAYAAADVFVIPSLEENLPYAIMEALACGTPVVGFNVGGIPELIQHQKNGYLAEYRSSEDLAKGIYSVLFQADTQALQTHARDYVLERYSQAQIAERYVSLYQSLS